MKVRADHDNVCHPERSEGPRVCQYPCNPASGTNAGAPFFASALWTRRLRAILHLLHATLREIFDERAYDRYLARTHTTRGRESYRVFTTERSAMTARKPRCC